MAPFSDETGTPKKKSSAGITVTLRDKVVAARDKWLQRTEENIESIVEDTLNSVFTQKILMSYLGIRQKWDDEWEVDTYNKNSPLLQRIERSAQDAADKYLEAAMDDVTFVPSEAEKKTIKATYKRAFLDYCKERSAYKAEQDAEEKIQELLENALEIDKIDMSKFRENTY